MYLGGEQFSGMNLDGPYLDRAYNEKDTHEVTLLLFTSLKLNLEQAETNPQNKEKAFQILTLVDNAINFSFRVTELSYKTTLCSLLSPKPMKVCPGVSVKKLSRVLAQARLRVDGILSKLEKQKDA